MSNKKPLLKICDIPRELSQPIQNTVHSVLETYPLIGNVKVTAWSPGDAVVCVELAEEIDVSTAEKMMLQYLVQGLLVYIARKEGRQ